VKHGKVSGHSIFSSMYERQSRLGAIACMPPSEDSLLGVSTLTSNDNAVIVCLIMWPGSHDCYIPYAFLL
jgi:hypothetical protein